MFFCITKVRKLFVILLASVILFFGIYVSATSDISTKTQDEIKVPILMYHSILQDKSRSGNYVVSPEVLEQDMVYLKENGYETVFVSDLISYVYQNTPLPSKPVILTFDDGHYNNMTYLLPLLERYDMKAVISVVGSYTENFSKQDAHNPNYSYLTWDDISQLHQTKRIEIANHTYDMHNRGLRNGCAIQKGESLLAYQEKLETDLIKLQTALQINAKIPLPITFTYPFGYICTQSQEVIEKNGFLASLSCYEKISTISKDKNSLYCLGRFNRPDGISTEEFMKKIKLP